MSDERNAINHPLLKAASAWLVAAAAKAAEAAQPLVEIGSQFGITGWDTLGIALATFYSFLLISEWFWKRLWRPLLEWLGWLKPSKRGKGDE